MFWIWGLFFNSLPLRGRLPFFLQFSLPPSLSSTEPVLSNTFGAHLEVNNVWARRRIRKPLWTFCLCVCLTPPLTLFFSRFLSHCCANCFTLNLIFLFLSLAVRFVGCGRGGVVRFECSNPADFRIEADGVVYAARSIQHSTLPASPLLIKASDTTTQQQWVTQVRLTSSTDSSQQVNIP